MSRELARPLQRAFVQAQFFTDYTAMFAAIVVTMVPSRRTLHTPVTTHYLIHHMKDTVGVAVAEGIEAQQELTGWLMDGDETVTIRARDPIPLGHKIALAKIAAGDSIIKYGHDIGRAVEPIGEGHHVHVHNVKTRRW